MQIVQWPAWQLNEVRLRCYKGVSVSRAKIWLSEVRSIGHAFIIEDDDGCQEGYPLRVLPAKGDRIGRPYRGEYKGVEGTYYDLPFGFPTDFETAKQRLNDPSIPAAIKKLIRDNFPMQLRTPTAALA